MQKGKSKGQNMRIIIIDRITNVCEMRNEVTAWSTGVYRVTCKVHLKLLWTCQQACLLAEETAFYLIFHFYFSFLTPEGKAHRVWSNKSLWCHSSRRHCVCDCK